MSNDTVTVNARRTGELVLKVKTKRAFRAMFAIVLISVLGAALVGIIFYAGLAAFAR